MTNQYLEVRDVKDFAGVEIVERLRTEKEKEKGRHGVRVGLTTSPSKSRSLTVTR